MIIIFGDPNVILPFCHLRFLMLSLILVPYPSDFEDASKLNMEMTKPGPIVDQRQDDLKDNL